jgi:hypothetical protein
MAKYRRLLSVARSSLEANQHAMAEKDKQIDALRTALQAEIAKQSQMHMMQRAGAGGSGDEDGSFKPRRVLRRVDVDSKVWLLFDYPGGVECWSMYSSEQEAADFVQRLPGEPLSIPTRSLTPEEGAKLVSLLPCTDAFTGALIVYILNLFFLSRRRNVGKRSKLWPKSLDGSRYNHRSPRSRRTHS